MPRLSKEMVTIQPPQERPVRFILVQALKLKKTRQVSLEGLNSYKVCRTGG